MVKGFVGLIVEFSNFMMFIKVVNNILGVFVKC